MWHSISIDSDNRGYRVIRHEPYASNVSITETVFRVGRYGGAMVVATASTTFTTRAGLDRQAPRLRSVTPIANEVIAANAVIYGAV